MKRLLNSSGKRIRNLGLIGLTMFFIGGIGVCADSEDDPEFQVLVFTKTTGFRHGSIPHGIEAIKNLGDQNDFRIIATEDAETFTAEKLEEFAVVVFLNTTGTLFNEDQREALKGFIRDGAGYVGIHSAADTEYDWEWYGQLVGAYFKSHPRIQEAVIRVEDREHPSTRHLPSEWTRTDEWYNYRTNPRGEVEVLASLKTDSFEGSEMPEDHPIAWFHQFEGGRAWYTGGGHTDESYAEEKFLDHLLGGILWAAGRE